ncbi:sigma-70 family RNA polymerase sigma factor [Paucibacter sp. DJ1R-11]|uniref:ECF-type sigma factor n=1 Tax=Paucibacter sp. DJ1R-11 TaxID=2893556 RepID=UPI0021E427A9|nr:ECF-type sigma factor [Paucibacter sp. DJ1R-11]MCV2364891.1 sigma-70 family RNA polymerase sigma factor [Paucibacter sp. DJ1R-11]
MSSAAPSLPVFDPLEITRWLASQEPAGSPAAAVNELFTLLYDELKRGARAQMRKEYAGHTLSATALTHEAWERLAAQTRTQWQNRAHFLGMAALMMRRILVNHAMAKKALKRDVPLVSLTLTEAQQVAAVGESPELLRVHEALLAFEQVDARAAQVVELRFFGGLEIEEIAELLALSPATVKRDWALARAWLHRELQA